MTEPTEAYYAVAADYLTLRDAMRELQAKICTASRMELKTIIDNAMEAYNAQALNDEKTGKSSSDH